jgi:hypothetical protein
LLNLTLEIKIVEPATVAIANNTGSSIVYDEITRTAGRESRHGSAGDIQCIAQNQSYAVSHKATIPPVGIYRLCQQCTISLIAGVTLVPVLLALSHNPGCRSIRRLSGGTVILATGRENLHHSNYLLLPIPSLGVGHLADVRPLRWIESRIELLVTAYPEGRVAAAVFLMDYFELVWMRQHV